MLAPARRSTRSALRWQWRKQKRQDNEGFSSSRDMVVDAEGSLCFAGQEPENLFDLRSVDLKPIRNLVQTGPGFEIVENGPKWKPRSAEQPNTADLPGNSFQGATFR